jgi:CelD/BcsL family acetyltransferase involved in cellulose biosynthesis
VRVVIHRQIPQDAQLRNEWNDLVAKMERPEVFYTYEWAMAVQRAYRSAMKPLLLLVCEGDLLVGVAALATSLDQGKAFFLAHTTADYCDFVSAAENRDEIVEAVFAELQRLALPRLTLANFPAEWVKASFLYASRRHGYTTFSRPAYRCARIVLGSNEQRQDLKRSITKRKALRYALKGLSKDGPLRMEHLQSREHIATALPQFIEAHTARFRAMGKSSNLAEPARQKFLFELTELLSQSGWLGLTRLSAGDRAVAWNYGFRFAGSWFYYQPTFETSLQRYSPGVCLLAKMVEEACDDDTIQIIDLGLGGESYKERFANSVRETLHVTIASSGASCLKEKIRYRTATMVKSMPMLESWIRSLRRQGSSA